MRATDTLYSTTAQFNILRAPTSSNGTSFGPGSANNLLKSNGTSIYWTTLAASDIPTISITDKTSGTLTVARGGTGQTSIANIQAGKDGDGNTISSTYLKKSGGDLTGDLGIIIGDTDKFLNFWYSTNKTAGGSWRLGALGSGSSDTNYFVIQSGTSTVSATAWNNAIRIGENTYDVAVGGNLYPLNNDKTLGTSSHKWANVYATTFTGDLTGHASEDLALTGGTISGNLTTQKFIHPTITGTGTAAVAYNANTSTNGKPALWKFDLSTATPAEGDIITITVPVAGHNNGVFVSTDNGTTYKPVSTIGASRLTTHYGVGTTITLVYDENGSTNAVYPVAGAAATTNVTGGCWRVLNYYDSNTTYSVMSKAEAWTGTATSSRVMRADYLKQILANLGGTGLSLTHNATDGIVLNLETVSIENGGTGATSASGARTNLGLGTMATENAANYLKLSGGTMTGDVTAPTFIGDLTGTASAVAWTGITGKPIELGAYSGALNSNGWETLGGRSSGAKIYVAYNNNPANWNSATYSSSIVFGAADTKGLLDVGHNSPIVTFGGASTSNSDDNNPKWYFKLSGTSGQTYTFPSSSKTLAATDGTGASGSWNINLALQYNSLTKGTNPTSRVYQGCWFGYDKNGIATVNRVGGGLESFIEPDGSTRTELRSYQYASGVSTYGLIGIITTQDGVTSYAFNGTGNTSFTGSISTKYITVDATDTANEGGEIKLAGAPGYQSGKYHACLDVNSQDFRIHSNGQVPFRINLESRVTTITQLILTNVLAVQYGGTGASTAVNARNNLKAATYLDLDNISQPTIAKILTAIHESGVTNYPALVKMSSEVFELLTNNSTIGAVIGILGLTNGNTNSPWLSFIGSQASNVTNLYTFSIVFTNGSITSRQLYKVPLTSI